MTDPHNHDDEDCPDCDPNPPHGSNTEEEMSGGSHHNPDT